MTAATTRRGRRSLEGEGRIVLRAYLGISLCAGYLPWSMSGLLMREVVITRAALVRAPRKRPAASGRGSLPVHPFRAFPFSRLGFPGGMHGRFVQSRYQRIEAILRAIWSQS